jgi:hypothetical protein
MTKQNTVTKKVTQNIPKITLQPKQLEYVNAKESIVFYGGGAGGKLTAAFKLP